MKQEKGQPYEIFQQSVQHRNRWFGIHSNMRKRWIRLIAKHNRLRQQTKLRFTLRRLFSMKTRLLTMSASIDKKIQVLFYLILRSAPKRWFRRNAPRGVNRAESTIPGIKKDTAIFRKRWIASALDSFQIYSKTLHCVVQL